ncbi:MAG: acetate--CoA ligase family protein, partial [Anaerolineales bacterium]|nr:acetate--CoA ligase family protein [Anaerolineales bacterium]
PATVPVVLQDCGRAGVQAAVIITAGFSEIGNRDDEKAILEIARENKIRFIGPNCAGLVNTHHNLSPTLETIPPQGNVSMITQSGAVGGIVLAMAHQQGLGIAKFVSYGNGADLREIDLLHFLADDPETDIIALYLESATDGRQFMEAVRSCTRTKPVVVIKSGRTASGKRATLSHTGSMAGADAVYDSALKQCGAIRVRTVEEMFDVCKGFSWLPRPDGKHLVIVTNSGGPGVMAADWAEDMGLSLAEPGQKSKDKLSEFLPSHCALKNPIDLTVEGTKEGYRKSLSVLLEEYDAALAINVVPAYMDSIPIADGICDVHDQTGKPIAASFLPELIVQKGIARLHERGVPNFPSGERAVSALVHMANYAVSYRMSNPPATPDPAIGNLPGKGQLLENESMALLRKNEIPITEFRVAQLENNVLSECGAIGYPVAIKVLSPDILHKTDQSGVILNVRNDQEAISAYCAIQRAAAGKDFRGVIIYPMIHGAQEVLVGISRDPQFGPVIAFGLGGVETEVWHDISLRVAPVEEKEAKKMISEIKSFPLLNGYRGREVCDLDSLVKLLANVSQLPFRYPEIDEIDLNPVFIHKSGCQVGDVRILRRSM